MKDQRLCQSLAADFRGIVLGRGRFHDDALLFDLLFAGERFGEFAQSFEALDILLGLREFGGGDFDARLLRVDFQLLARLNLLKREPGCGDSFF